jgi:hypothetical protein
VYDGCADVLLADNQHINLEQELAFASYIDSSEDEHVKPSQDKVLLLQISGALDRTCLAPHGS